MSAIFSVFGRVACNLDWWSSYESSSMGHVVLHFGPLELNESSYEDNKKFQHRPRESSAMLYQPSYGGRCWDHGHKYLNFFKVSLSASQLANQSPASQPVASQPFTKRLI